MQKWWRKPELKKHIIINYVLSFLLLGFTWFIAWPLGLLMTILLGLALYYTIKQEHQITEEQEEYISTLSHRVKKVGEEALLEMPIGIVLYSENYQIEWVNRFMNGFSDSDTLVGESLDVFDQQLLQAIKEEKDHITIDVEDKSFLVSIRKEERLLYFSDRTKQIDIQTRYSNEKTVLGIIFLDNYEEITSGMDDTAKSHVNSDVTSLLNAWSSRYGIYLKRISQERFLAIFNKEILHELEQTKFDVLDEVRELISDNKNVPLTLSFGVGYGELSLPQLGELAQSSLDLALGRGGDQVVLKDHEGKVRFFGGKTNPMEKRTRVRARVISHALQDLVIQSEQVMIMGHKNPDMDSIGSSIGVLKMALSNDVEAYVVIDEAEFDSGVDRLMSEVEATSLGEYFITREEALEMVTKQTLLVVVDTHKPALVQEEKLLNKTEHVVVIDHHRRGEDFIDQPILVYMEPYASSAAELITELLEYQPKRLRLTSLEATALLAGIIVDTKSFTLRTGSRTFDAASYLRSKGADTILVQRFLEEDLDIYIKRAHIIEQAMIHHGQIAIARARKGESFGPVVIAQAADTLLTMSGIEAAFVLSERSDGRIGISARSLGDVNVQRVMEQMEGGGHLTNAATQLADTSIDEAYAQLLGILDELFEGGNDE
ncbi:c-di-AMP phosphodiesterase, consists of a GGDEF-like and DHH domains [Halolactibacillus halophilus]|uniref:Cyclic-di-AMP phosphodiesterase n=1 Tax=Halolactibacillus halophilus TaxID=306540 RepID=A0A1I5R633_9BACI|nr:DHH family phosphoesterase [Halolactibacillus halophilus]GEM02160.1 cyclic-di-AMP phosphodiesterase GdpP [Halolactibacillus halophilus]SFP53751.1 c-di-AMP phosphodiesterase, consists of a GGDEF-like and DHH domains [Halolactibacillus halophilus]